MDRDECACRSQTIRRPIGSPFNSGGGGGRWAFGFLVEKMKAKAARRPEGWKDARRSVLPSYCVMPHTLGRPPYLSAKSSFSIGPSGMVGPADGPCPPRAGINMDSIVGDRLEPVFSIFDFHQDIRSDLQRYPPPRALSLQTCAKCLLILVHRHRHSQQLEPTKS